MQHLKSILATSLIAAVALPTLATARPLEAGQFTGNLTIGAPVFGTGKLHGGATTTVPSLTALNPALPAVPAVLVIEERKFSKVYDTPALLGVEVGYGLNDNVELFGGINYSKADKGRTQVGVANVAALNASLPVYGEFGDIENLEVEGGARYFFPGDRFSPFIGASIGAVQQEAVSATFTIPDAPAGGITLANVPFFKKTTLLSLGAEVGSAMSFTDRVDGRLSVGAKYLGEADDNDTALAGLGLGSINNGSERWVYPIKATLAVRF
jgi:hypothetical protein